MKNYNEIVGANIRLLREYREMSQHQLAVKCGHDTSSARSWISKIESGQRSTYTSDVGIIAENLGVEPQALFIEMESPDPRKQLRRLLAYAIGIPEKTKTPL